MLKVNRNKIIKILGIGSMCLFLLGCSEESLLISEENVETMVLHTDTEQEEYGARKNMSGDNSGKESSVKADIGKEASEEKTVTVSGEEAVKQEIAVHICGAVSQPGVYLFNKKSRIYEGIQKAGGFREEAAKDYLNLALMMEDGMKIEVPTEEMVKKLAENGQETVMGISYGIGESAVSEEDGKIDLNTADEALLCTLPGIGESKARSIIAYREENGRFEKVEDIMNISGIKEAAYEKIKDFVTVLR